MERSQLKPWWEYKVGRAKEIELEMVYVCVINGRKKRNKLITSSNERDNEQLPTLLLCL